MIGLTLFHHVWGSERIKIGDRWTCARQFAPVLLSCLPDCPDLPASDWKWTASEWVPLTIWKPFRADWSSGSGLKFQSVHFTSLGLFQPKPCTTVFCFFPPDQRQRHKNQNGLNHQNHRYTLEFELGSKSQLHFGSRRKPGLIQLWNQTMWNRTCNIHRKDGWHLN